jgi:ribosomal protein S18 acetylase RimI-like enzyme
MLNWYYNYIQGGKTVTEAVSTPEIPGLEFSHVYEQIIIPHLCARGVSGLDSVRQTDEADDVTPMPAEFVAENLTVDGLQFSLYTDVSQSSISAETKRQSLVLRLVKRAELHEAAAIWNDVVAAGDSFPGDEILSDEEVWAMLMAQTASVCAMDGGEVVGVYILHPNNIGRCGHIANASYAVRADRRGRGVGRALVEDCIERAKACGFRGLQFNAVVAANTAAIALYLKLGFRVVGTVPGGYRYRDGGYRDTLIMLKTWADTP